MFHLLLDKQDNNQANSEDRAIQIWVLGSISAIGDGIQAGFHLVE